MRVEKQFFMNLGTYSTNRVKLKVSDQHSLTLEVSVFLDAKLSEHVLRFYDIV